MLKKIQDAIETLNKAATFIELQRDASPYITLLELRDFITKIAPPIEPVPDHEQGKYHCEHVLQLDRDRIHGEVEKFISEQLRHLKANDHKLTDSQIIFMVESEISENPEDYLNESDLVYQITGSELVRIVRKAVNYELGKNTDSINATKAVCQILDRVAKYVPTIAQLDELHDVAAKCGVNPFDPRFCHNHKSVVSVSYFDDTQISEYHKDLIDFIQTEATRVFHFKKEGITQYYLSNESYTRVKMLIESSSEVCDFIKV